MMFKRFIRKKTSDERKEILRKRKLAEDALNHLSSSALQEIARAALKVRIDAK